MRFISFLLIFCGLNALASDCVLWVNPNESLQEIIDRVASGSVLCLGEGVWYENLVITKSITIRGKGPQHTVIQVRQTDFYSPAVSIRGPRTGTPLVIVLENLTLRSDMESPWPAWGSAGIEALGLVYLVIRNCQIQRFRTGVLLMEHVQALITQTSILGEVGDKVGDGIELLGRSQLTLKDVNINWLGDGVLVGDYAQVQVLQTTIANARFGLRVFGHAQASIIYTQISNCDEAVVASQEGQLLVVESLLTQNGVGVVLMDRAIAVLHKNHIKGSRYYGVLAALHDPRLWFSGFVAGAANTIPGPDDPNGNLLGSAFPSELGFLMVSEGGFFTAPKK